MELSWNDRREQCARALPFDGETLRVLALLDLVLNALDEVEAVVRKARAAHADEATRAQHAAVAYAVKLTRPLHRLRRVRGRPERAQGGLHGILVRRVAHQDFTSRLASVGGERRNAQGRKLRNRKAHPRQRLYESPGGCDGRESVV